MINFKQNRYKLYEKLQDNSLLILYSGALKHASADEGYPFKANMNFYYLTGIQQNNVYLVAKKYHNVIEETLFIYENDPIKVRWIGAYLYPEEATNISGVENVKFVDEFDSFLAKILRHKVIKNVYLDLEKPHYDGQVNFGYVLKDKVNAYSFGKKILNVYEDIVTLRGCKSSEEIELYKEDVRITKLALEEVLKRLPKLENEYQVQAVFEGAIKYIGNAKPSFGTIAASGKNAAILHYGDNNMPLNKNDMILLDLGAECNNYHADISRTYPISGKYSPLQKKIYNIVLECNKHIIEMIKPGVSIKDLQNETINFLAEGCLKEGLIKEKEEIKNYYFHGVSHHIGLDTHDPYPRYVGVLQPGMIISCEPGLYFEELGIGVRIEDDILVTEDGNENLSEDIIKEIADIEAYMAKYNY